MEDDNTEHEPEDIDPDAAVSAVDAEDATTGDAKASETVGDHGDGIGEPLTDTEGEEVREDASPGGMGFPAFRFGTLTFYTRYGHAFEILFDSSNALRLIKAFETRTERVDRLDPFTASGADGWLGVSLDELVMISWMPGIPRQPNRTVVDPLVPNASAA